MPDLVMVCGSRTWRDEATIIRVLAELPGRPTIIHGGAIGADRIAGAVAQELGLPIRVYRPNYKVALDRRRQAPMLRNIAMLDEHPDLVIAFWDGQSPGTEMAITTARRRGIPVDVYYPEDDDPYEPMSAEEHAARESGDDYDG